MRVLSIITALCVALGSPSLAAEGDSLSFGIVPQQSASRLAKTWGPLLSELSARTGQEIVFKTTKDIPTFEACLEAGAYDIAYMNPMHYAVFAEGERYRAILRQANKRLKGVIVARKDGPLALQDLDGARLAFPSPGAFGASVLTRATLSETGITFEPAYVKSHDSVYRAVAAGLMPAGGGVLRTFRAVDPAIRDQLQIIHETDAFTPHALAVQAGLPSELAVQLQAVLVQIALDRPELVKNIGMSGFQISEDRDWDDVRALNMPTEATGILSDRSVTCPSD